MPTYVNNPNEAVAELISLWRCCRNGYGPTVSGSYVIEDIAFDRTTCENAYKTYFDYNPDT